MAWILLFSYLEPLRPINHYVFDLWHQPGDVTEAISGHWAELACCRWPGSPGEMRATLLRSLS